MDLFGKICDVLRLSERHTERLELGNARGEDRLGIDLADRRQHPLPDRLLCLGRDLLADDVVHDGGKEISVHFSLDMADAVDDLGHALVLLFEVSGLLFPVGKIHRSPSPPRCLKRMFYIIWCHFLSVKRSHFRNERSKNFRTPLD